MEEWRDIKGYEGLYQVSSEGRVKSLKFGKEKILKGYLRKKDGYSQVTLRKNGKQKLCLIHRLVARAFIGECPEGYDIDHINTTRDDNRVENLRYCTRKENTNNPLSSYNRKTSKSFQNHLKTIHEQISKSVKQITMSGEIVAVYPSISEAARQTGCKINGIWECCQDGDG